MHRAGDLVIVGDADLHERYQAEIAKDERDPRRNPLVRILAVIDYPRQTPIIYTEFAHENPPIAGGRVCRMSVERALGSGPVMDYAQSCADALARAAAEARANDRQDVLDILARHAQGVFGRPRRLCEK